MTAPKKLHIYSFITVLTLNLLVLIWVRGENFFASGAAWIGGSLLAALLTAIWVRTSPFPEHHNHIVSVSAVSGASFVLLLGHTLPAAYTATFGVETIHELTVLEKVAMRGGGCGPHFKIKGLEGRLGNRLCTPPEIYRQSIPGTRLLTKGRESELGTWIDNISANPQGQAQPSSPTHF